MRKGELAAVLQQQGDVLVVRYAASDQVKAATINGVLSRWSTAATSQRRVLRHGCASTRTRSKTSRCNRSSSPPAASCRGASRRLLPSVLR
nr:hypothetical protein [Angustibacter aerolatus]